MGTMTIKQRANKQRKAIQRIARITRKARAKLDGAIGGGGFKFWPFYVAVEEEGEFGGTVFLFANDRKDLTG